MPQAGVGNGCVRWSKWGINHCNFVCADEQRKRHPRRPDPWHVCECAGVDVDHSGASRLASLETRSWR